MSTVQKCSQSAEVDPKQTTLVCSFVTTRDLARGLEAFKKKKREKRRRKMRDKARENRREKMKEKMKDKMIKRK